MLHKSEINRLAGEISQGGYSLVPVESYFKGSKVKILLGIGKGKKLFDKREDLKKKDAERTINRALKNNY